jgi:hypothetical protein
MARHSEFLDGEMPSVDAELWRTHLASCAACARYDRVLRKGLGVLHRDQQADADSEFMLHLRYRLAYEEERIAMGPVTAGAATSVTVAAVLALAAWLPIMFMSRMQETPPAVGTVNTNLDPAASEIAWHGGNAFAQHQAAHQVLAPDISLSYPNPGLSLIDRGYTPLIIEPPTAPPSYTQVTLTSFSR